MANYVIKILMKGDGVDGVVEVYDESNPEFPIGGHFFNDNPTLRCAIRGAAESLISDLVKANDPTEPRCPNCGSYSVDVQEPWVDTPIACRGCGWKAPVSVNTEILYSAAQYPE